MSTPVPFRWITGLDPKAQKEIERNFFALQQQIVAGSSSTIYDAIIDPALSASNAATHNYKNLTDLLSSETLLPTRIFTVGVIPRFSSVITETGTLSPAGPLVISALGRAGDSTVGFFGKGALVQWDLAGHIITTSWMLEFHGLYIENSGSQIAGVANTTAPMFFYDCTMDGVDSAGTTRKITSPGQQSGLPVYAEGTLFRGCQFNGPIIALDCNYSLMPATGTAFNFSPNNSGVYWDGGQFINHQSSATNITFTGQDVYLRWIACLDNNYDVGASTGTHTLTLNSTVRGILWIERMNNQFNITNGIQGDIDVKGNNWKDVTLAGAAGHSTRFEGSCSHVLDITGPAEVYATDGGQDSQAQVILRGSGIVGNICLITLGANPWVKCVGLKNSSVSLAFYGPSLGSQAYTIDAASTHAVLTTGGTTDANFSVASTNAGTVVRVISETPGT